MTASPTISIVLPAKNEATGLSSLLPQLKKDETIKIERIISGLKIVLWGFFKKIVI